MIELKKSYGKFNGKETYLYTIGENNLEVDIGDFGARINSIRFDKTDIALGFNSVQDYLESGTYAGTTIGRVANRIADGRFVIGGRLHYVSVNDGKNHLHGGIRGFDKRLFTALSHTANSICLQYISEDGEEGYPGKLCFNVKFTIKDGSLCINYAAVSNMDTLWCPTNHTYFNLDGEDSGDCRDDILQLNADSYTPTDDTLIPTGDVLPIEGTPFDFLKAKPIIADFTNPALRVTNGYDHNYIANDNNMAFAYSIKTGISLCVSSDMPCFQFYTGGAIKSCKGKSRQYGEWSGFCIEPQFCPNAINFTNFDKPIIYTDKRYEHYIKYTFGISG